jgi:hypothetical protein
MNPHQASAEHLDPDNAFPVAVGLPESSPSDDSQDGSEAQHGTSNNP